MSSIPSVIVSEDDWLGAVAYFDDDGNRVYVTDIAGSKWTNPNTTLVPSESGVYDQKNTGWSVVDADGSPDVYINGIGYSYEDPNAVAPPEPAPAPAPAPMPQMPQPRPMQKMRRMQKFAGNFGMGGSDEFRYDPYGQNPKSNTGRKGIVNSLMGSSPFKLTQPGGGKNPYGGQ